MSEPKELKNAFLQSLGWMIALSIIIIIPEVKHSPAELQISNNITWFVSTGVAILAWFKLGDGKTWARVFFLCMNTILILGVIIFYFVDKDIVGDFIKDNAFLSIWGYIFLVSSGIFSSLH